MTTTTYTHLTDRTVLRLVGKDTIPFLQGLLTRNMEGMAEGECRYALMLTPQGKFLYDFFIIIEKDNLLLDIYKATKDALLRKLAMYKLRSAVSIEETDLQVFAASEAVVGACSDPRDAAMGYRAILAQPPAGTAASLADYELKRLKRAIPSPEDMTEGFPLQFRMDELHAVDFDKGCYVGQEVTTRSKHRGNIRKTLYTVEGVGLPASGTPVTVDGRAVGTLLSNNGSLGIALLEKEAADKTLKAGDVPLTLLLPPH